VFQLDVSALQLELEQLLEVARVSDRPCERFEPRAALSAVEEHAQVLPASPVRETQSRRSLPNAYGIQTEFRRISCFGVRTAVTPEEMMIPSHAVAIASVVAASIAMVRLSLQMKTLTFRTPRRCPSCGRIRRRDRCRCVSSSA
jgi:hypothetical protein